MSLLVRYYEAGWCPFLSTRCPPHGLDLSGQFRLRRRMRQHGHRRAAVTVLTWAGTIN
jgi:hypothetical protein